MAPFVSCIFSGKKKTLVRDVEELPKSQVPWLVYSQGKGRKHPTLIPLSLSDQQRYVCNINIPHFHHKIAVASFGGWLLLLSNKDYRKLLLWNPFSLATIELPRLKKKAEPVNYTYVLSSAPGDPNCTVLLWHRGEPKIIFCKPGNHYWTVQDISKEMKYKNRDGVDTVAKLQDAVCMRDGIVYASCFAPYVSDRRLFTIEVVESSSQVLVKSLDVGLPSGGHVHGVTRLLHYLVESCGELLMVIKCYRGENFKEISHLRVFKMDFARMNWEKMGSLKDRAIFLGDNYGLSSSVSDAARVEGNCIYLTLHDNRIFSFNMEHETMSISMSCPDILHFSNWIVPDLRLTYKRTEEDEDKIEKECLQNGDRNEEKYLKNDDVQAIKSTGEEKKEVNLVDLPLDILELIGKRLTIIDYMRFRITCRKFGMAAPPIQWRTASIESEKQLLYPWFMSFKNDRNTCDLIDPKYGDKYFINFPELLSGAIIHCSKDGWLLMSTDVESFYFFNPSTKMIHPLPKMNPSTAPSHLVFSSSPTSSDCVVVGITAFYGWGTDICVIRSRNEEWQEWKLDRFDDEIINPTNNTPIFYDERFWLLDDDGDLGVVKVEEDEIRWEVLAEPQSPCRNFEFNYLVECDGQLLSVFLGYSGEWVQVFRLDLSKMDWIEIKSLGNHMLFVSYSSSFSMVAKIAGMENKIYFPRLCGHSITFYSLETEKFHTFTSEDSMKDLQLSSFPLRCGWIEPKWD